MESIEVATERTGTFQARLIDYDGLRLAMRTDPDAQAPELSVSPVFPGTEAGLRSLREWVRGELGERYPHNPHWMSLPGTEAFMTDAELDAWRPGWRAYAVTVGGSRLDRPVFDVRLDTMHLVCPVGGSWASIGVMVDGPMAHTAVMLETLPTYTAKAIEAIVDGFAGRPKAKERMPS